MKVFLNLIVKFPNEFLGGKSNAPSNNFEFIILLVSFLLRHAKINISPIPNSFDFSLNFFIISFIFVKSYGSYIPSTGLLFILIYLLSII